MEKKKYNLLCLLGFILAVPLQIVFWVTVELALMLVGLVISIVGVVTTRKGIKKGRALGIIGIVFSILGMLCVVSFCAMLLFIASGI